MDPTNTLGTEYHLAKLSYEPVSTTHLVEKPCELANAVPTATGSARLLRSRAHELHFLSHSQSR